MKNLARSQQTSRSNSNTQRKRREKVILWGVSNLQNRPLRGNLQSDKIIPRGWGYWWFNFERRKKEHTSIVSLKNHYPATVDTQKCSEEHFVGRNPWDEWYFFNPLLHCRWRENQSRERRKRGRYSVDGETGTRLKQIVETEWATVPVLLALSLGVGDCPFIFTYFAVCGGVSSSCASGCHL